MCENAKKLRWYHDQIHSLRTKPAKVQESKHKSSSSSVSIPKSPLFNTYATQSNPTSIIDCVKKTATFLTEKLQLIYRTKHQDVLNTAEPMRQIVQEPEELVPIEQEVTALQHDLEAYYKKLHPNKVEYRLHAVFSHRGQANNDHDLIHIYDWENERWLEYNDDTITVVKESEVLRDMHSKYENLYYLVYVDAHEIHWLMHIVNRLKRSREQD
jgi:hypothetical protein